jgi:hypothetical protein
MQILELRMIKLIETKHMSVRRLQTWDMQMISQQKKMPLRVIILTL